MSPSQTPPPTSSSDASRPSIATFVFEDFLKKPIKGLSIKITCADKTYTGETDDKGLGVTINDLQKNQDHKIYVKKQSGRYELKGIVTPKNDVNSYTIRSPELHLSGTTRLTPKEELEAEISIPTIRDGEVLTVNRLLGELAPFIGSAQIISEVGQIAKDYPKRKTLTVEDPVTHKKTRIVEIEHHYKATKTGKPKIVAVDLLGSRLNYPANASISDAMYEDMAKELGCEVAALKAISQTETGGVSFFENGLPKILFERHKFYEFTKPTTGAHPYAQYSDICSPNVGGYGASGIHQYERLVKAAALNRQAALMACSWGAFQVLAEYYSQCGYTSAEEMANDCMKTADAHAKLFLAFLKKEKKNAVKALKDKDWRKFTTHYNGANWESQNPEYPSQMAAHYEEFKK